MRMTDKKIEGYPRYAPGTKVPEKHLINKDVTYTMWQPEVQYSWALGRANVKFLEGLKDGKIFGIKCHYL